MYLNEIVISTDEYFQLRKDQLKLQMLEEGGVDDWEWYSESLSPEGGTSLEDEIKRIKYEIYRKE